MGMKQANASQLRGLQPLVTSPNEVLLGGGGLKRSGVQ